MVKKNSKNSKYNKEKSSITARIEKAQKADVFEGMDPSEHVAKLKQEVFSITEKQIENLEKNYPSFPWTEFLIGFVLGCVLLVVMFLFHISFAKNVNTRISQLENRIAMISPIITSPETQYIEISTRQNIFESELNRFKKKLKKSTFEVGSFSFNGNVEKEIELSKQFKNPIVFFQIDDSIASSSIRVNDKSFTCKIIVNDLNKKYTFSWIAIEK